MRQRCRRATTWKARRRRWSATFKFRKGETVVQTNGPLVVMNGDAAGWVGLYPPAEGGETGWFHGREGAGVSIVLDVVPTQDLGEGRAGEGLGHISNTEVAKHFRNT
jgi:hypothetical protein